MVDKRYCMSSYLVFRYIIDNDMEFYEGLRHQVYNLMPENERVPVNDEYDIDAAVNKQLESIKREKKIGILLSGGMDSACLASYLNGCDAYTFRFPDGNIQREELARAEYYAKKYELTLHYVDISWDIVNNNMDVLMQSKGAPIHSIEPQIFQAIKQAEKDGIELMVIGDAADYVFGGMDGLYAKDWSFEEFKERYTYLNPYDVLIDPESMDFAFEKYRDAEKIDFINFMHEYADIESYASYENAFVMAKMPFIDPYESLKMSEPLDLDRIRSGESKYLIRALFKLKYPEIDVPQKLPMPRPVDSYFANWEGPKRHEFKKNIDMSKFSGNQKWQMYCLERFLNIYEPEGNSWN